MVKSGASNTPSFTLALDPSTPPPQKDSSVMLAGTAAAVPIPQQLTCRQIALFETLEQLRKLGVRPTKMKVDQAHGKYVLSNMLPL